MDAIDDRLLVATMPARPRRGRESTQCLRRWRDVVAARAEHDDRRAHVAQIDAPPVGGRELRRREPFADEEVIDDVLDLVAAEHDVPAQPALELQIARRLGVDVREHAVLLRPPGVAGFMFSKFCTSHAPSKSPPPMSLKSAVTQLPPLRPPV